MSVLKKDELMEKLKTILGEKTDDETLSFIEDVSDTYDDAFKDKENDEDWQKKYEENDKMWREKYRDRFFNSSGNDDDEDDEPIIEKKEVEEKPLTFENLFKGE